MSYELILNIVNTFVLFAFGFIAYRYFPVVKNISTWMKDVSSVSKNTHDVLSRLYNPEEVEKVINIRMQLIKNKQSEELLKTQNEYQKALQEKTNEFKEIYKTDIRNFVLTLFYITDYLEVTDLSEIKTKLEKNIDESYHEIVDLVFDTQIKKKINALFSSIGHSLIKQKEK